MLWQVKEKFKKNPKVCFDSAPVLISHPLESGDPFQAGDLYDANTICETQVCVIIYACYGFRDVNILRLINIQICV